MIISTVSIIVRLLRGADQCEPDMRNSCSSSSSVKLNMGTGGIIHPSKLIAVGLKSGHEPSLVESFLLVHTSCMCIPHRVSASLLGRMLQLGEDHTAHFSHYEIKQRLRNQRQVGIEIADQENCTNCHR
jgi:hypothetical protein